MRTVIGFDSALTDDQVIAFIERYSVTVEAVYLASNGFTGTQRAYVALPPRGLVQSARDGAINTFTNALDGNLVRLDRFLKENTQEDLSADAALAAKGRSLLNIRSQVQAVLDAARRGDALIYGLEVKSADQAKLKALRADPRVVGVQANDGTGAARLKPASLEIEYVDPAVASRSAAETLASMQALLRTKGRD